LGPLPLAIMILLSHSLGRKIVATGTAAVALAFLYEVTILDSQYAARAEFRESAAAPTPGAHLRFTATAYCRGTTTASGVNVRNGIAAADPDLLPVGSVVQVDRLGDRYNGIYTVMDTGPAVQGRHIDIYMWSCDEARYEFGRRLAGLTVLRLGWNPRASTPSLVDRLFRHREAAQPSEVPAVTPTPEAVVPLKEAAQKVPGS
jgi:3D (Asp-Asp-Asp) domain-containing protein